MDCALILGGKTLDSLPARTSHCCQGLASHAYMLYDVYYLSSNIIVILARVMLLRKQLVLVGIWLLVLSQLSRENQSISCKV